MIKKNFNAETFIRPVAKDDAALIRDLMLKHWGGRAPRRAWQELLSEFNGWHSRLQR